MSELGIRLVQDLKILFKVSKNVSVSIRVIIRVNLSVNNMFKLIYLLSIENFR